MVDPESVSESPAFGPETPLDGMAGHHAYTYLLACFWDVEENWRT